MHTRLVSLSILYRVCREVGPAGFRQRFPVDWFIWQPGPWRPATNGLGRDRAPTMQLAIAPAPRPAGEDCFCFPLAPEDGPLRIGRAGSNHLVINDLTFSREQFVLERRSQWEVRALGAGAALDQTPLTPRPRELRSGQQLSAGDVRLSFVAADDLAHCLIARDWVSVSSAIAQRVASRERASVEAELE